MANDEGRQGDPGRIQIRVCLACGADYPVAEDEASADLTCERCGGTVFRNFRDPRKAGEASAEYAEVTGRDLDTDDPAGDATEGDLRDLNEV